MQKKFNLVYIADASARSLSMNEEVEELPVVSARSYCQDRSRGNFGCILNPIFFFFTTKTLRGKHRKYILIIKKTKQNKTNIAVPAGISMTLLAFIMTAYLPPLLQKMGVFSPPSSEGFFLDFLSVCLSLSLSLLWIISTIYFPSLPFSS